MSRWTFVFLAMAAVLAPLAFSELGRQFTDEAKLLVAIGLATMLLLIAADLRQRRR